ncbi:hypothetical protein INS49_005355 [Diaporthe citri]|uniref:uncharacterized protein n=1 Tax=Diaporthe citri TaxID=83186 RepID=UPI001C826146|nr:uncharacterized protein INS49_005355 [Diaporthe citri]KAG6353647.1 hypothetical protein INS49_005355 [Diaporthe citri]
MAELDSAAHDPVQTGNALLEAETGAGSDATHVHYYYRPFTQKRRIRVSQALLESRTTTRQSNQKPTINDPSP